jgi:hypothetical protein
MKKSNLVGSLILAGLLTSVAVLAGENRHEPMDHAVTLAAKGAIGAGGIYYGVKKHPEVKSAQADLEEANEKLQSEKRKVHAAEAHVTLEEKSMAIEAAKSEVKAAEDQLRIAQRAYDDTAGIRAIKAAAKAANIARSELDSRKDTTAWNAHWQNQTIDMLTDDSAEAAERQLDEAKNAISNASDNLRSASNLKVATPELERQLVLQAEKLVENASKVVEEKVGSLKAKTAALSPKGNELLVKRVAIGVGALALTDAAIQTGVLLNGGDELFPIPSYVGRKMNGTK